MTRLSCTLFAALVAPWMLFHCSSSSAPPPDGGHTVITKLPDSGPDSEVICGALNQACCGLSLACNAGLTCDPGGTSLTCIACGASGEPCCLSSDSGIIGCSNAALTCQSATSEAGLTATCTHCGTVGDPCCQDNTCTSTGACCDQIMGACIGADAQCSSGSSCAGGTCAP